MYIQGSQMEEEIRQLERKMKQALSEQEHLREHNTYLTSELDRFVHACNHTIYTIIIFPNFGENTYMYNNNMHAWYESRATEMPSHKVTATVNREYIFRV